MTHLVVREVTPMVSPLVRNKDSILPEYNLTHVDLSVLASTSCLHVGDVIYNSWKLLLA